MSKENYAGSVMWAHKGGISHFYLLSILIKQYKIMSNLALVLADLVKILAPAHKVVDRLSSAAVKPLMLAQVMIEEKNSAKS